MGTTGIETVTELRASEERIKMQQPALRVFLFLAVVSAQPFENKNNSSSAIPFRQKRSTYHWLYCPTGEQFIAVHSSDIMYGHVMEEFEHKCQCYSDSTSRGTLTEAIITAVRQSTMGFLLVLFPNFGTLAT